MQIFLYTGILVYMLFSTTVAARFGIENRDTATTLLLALPVLTSFFTDRKNIPLREMNSELCIIAIGIILCLIKHFIGDDIIIKRIFFFMIFPMLVSIALSAQSFESRRVIRYLIIVFFIAECSLAIYERIAGINIFPYEKDILIDINPEASFRSTAFLGHPLMNALVVSTIMGIALISEMRLSAKGFIFILGIIAILCFNARGATLIWIVITIILFFYLFKDKEISKSSRFVVFLFATIATGAVYYLVVEKGFGDRLVNNENGLYDSSTKARVDVFAAFSYIKSEDLIFGQSSYYLYITDKLGQAGVENSYIVLMIYYGIPAFIILLLAYYIWLTKYFKNLTLVERTIIFLSFIVVGSTNNSLADATPWMIFIFCMNAFLPNAYNYQLNKLLILKHIEAINKLSIQV